MEVVLIGYRMVNFTDQDTGEVVNGVSVFYRYDDDNTVGQMSAKVFIKKPALFQQLADVCGGKEMIPGSHVLFHYNNRGGLVMVTPA